MGNYIVIFKLKLKALKPTYSRKWSSAYFVCLWETTLLAFMLFRLKMGHVWLYIKTLHLKVCSHCDSEKTMCIIC